MRVSRQHPHRRYGFRNDLLVIFLQFWGLCLAVQDMSLEDYLMELMRHLHTQNALSKHGPS
jgi:hypothetical protein